MKITGIIAEYNPFHNGHAYQIKAAKERGSDCAVAVCGGLFSQRGELSVCTKTAKAKAAAAGGADLVIELPLCYTLSPAPDFAAGGVKIIDALGCADFLTFGCEEENPDRLFDVLKALETIENTDAVKNALKNGCSLPSSRQQALFEINPEFADIISKPNNILALEYISALKKIGSAVTPVAVPRKGALHGSGEIFENICSATKLREIMRNDIQSAAQFMPKGSFDIISNEAERGRAPLDISRIENAMLFSLRKLGSDDISQINGVCEGMENLICEGIKEHTSIEKIVEYCSGKRYTKSRIRRILMCSVLGITKELAHVFPPYIRVLGFNEIGREALKIIKKTASVPVVTKASEIPKISDNAKAVFAVESLAADLVSLAFDPPGKSGLEFTENFFS